MIKKISHFIMIYICFILWGILQERIFTFSSDKFDRTLFILVFQSLCGLIISGICSIIYNISFAFNSKRIFFSYGLISMLKIVSFKCSIMSLDFVSYPTLLISKSSKLIPTLLMNFIIYKRVISIQRIIMSIVITFGLILFVLNDGKNGNVNSITGILLIILGLCMDGSVISFQENIFRKENVEYLHMMFYSNLFTLILSLFIFMPKIYSLLSSFLMLIHSKIFLLLIVYSILNGIGQTAIYSMLKTYGSVTVTTITVTRKMFTILISLLYINKGIKNIQWLGVFIVLIPLFYEIFNTTKIKK
ncbi:UAA transporter family protein [Spraguea lophii 42_110]|uniref:UAA transporter family protein n=1 Tax=Spraguea lophii (strain 42_110) TaxID=1358809 RepID=S7W854_SPRLO|nr:UAA transporter family protein [Spraguea lophii 42_110]